MQSLINKDLIFDLLFLFSQLGNRTYHDKAISTTHTQKIELSKSGLQEIQMHLSYCILWILYCSINVVASTTAVALCMTETGVQILCADIGLGQGGLERANKSSFKPDKTTKNLIKSKLSTT